jgi:hypothetical protein
MEVENRRLLKNVGQLTGQCPTSDLQKEESPPARDVAIALHSTFLQDRNHARPSHWKRELSLELRDEAITTESSVRCSLPQTLALPSSPMAS